MTEKTASKTATVEIYTSMLCGYCAAAKKLLEKRNINYHEIDVTFDPKTRKKMTKRANGKTSVPQIFINDLNIGGCDELYALDKNGKLNDLINEK